LAIFVFEETAEEANIWWNPQVQHQTRSLALSDRGSHCNQEEWLKELEDTSPANEAKGQQQVLVARNCSRTDMIPKLPQQESQV